MIDLAPARGFRRATSESFEQDQEVRNRSPVLRHTRNLENTVEDN